MTTGTDLVPTQPGGAIISAEQQAQWAADAGQGAENIETQDIAVPFIGHVQGLSKQLEEGNPKYLPTAKIGSLFNTVTGEVFDAKEGLVVVPVTIQKVVAESEPKREGGKGGGKILAVYTSRAEAAENAETGNVLLDGFRVFVLYQTRAGGWSPAIISFCTKSKVYTMKNWNALLTGLRVPGPNGTRIQPPIFAYTYRITSALQQFDDGTAAVLKVATEAPTPDEVYQQAKQFRKAFAEGAVKVGSEVEPDTQATPPEQADDDLPF
jgi:hypothetical protein